MSTERGREAFANVKEIGEEGEWSWGFPRGVKTAPMTDEWRAKGARRLIAAALPIETSPVFIGAGWGTGTMYTKEAPEEPDPAIEAARVAAEEAAAETARQLQAKARIDAEATAALERRFTRGLPTGAR
jgi:hypothetical protein